jgi:glutamate synthase (ferredoxin)
MAELGFRKITDMVGRTDALEPKHAVEHWKAKGIDLSSILYSPPMGPEVGRFCTDAQDHGLEKSMDITTLLELCKPAIERGEKMRDKSSNRGIDLICDRITSLFDIGVRSEFNILVRLIQVNYNG